MTAYKDATVAESCGSSSTSTPTSCPTLVGYAEALAHDNANPSDQWLVRDASGNPIHDRYYTSDYFVNVGSASYQQRALTYALATIQNPSPDFDGMQFDNTNPAYLYRTQRNSAGAATQGYVNGTLLSDSLWQSSMVKFLSYVGGGLRGKGYYVVANGGVSGDNDGSLTSSWWKSIGPYVNGLGIEFFEEGPDKVLFYNTSGDWHGFFNSWLSIVDTAQSLGKDFIGGGHGIGTDTNKMSYGKAAFLLKWNGRPRLLLLDADRHLRPLELRLDDPDRQPQRRHVRGRHRLAP